MKTYTNLFCIVCAIVGAIGIVESIANFSLFQIALSACLMWLAFAVKNDVSKTIQDGENS